jgi:molybdate transport system substrate-binding protein
MYFKIFTTILFFIFSSSCTEEKRKIEASLLVYCGVTMVEPVSIVAKEFEKKYNVMVTITQGGSQDLYNSLKLSKQGDLYIPGSSSYRVNNQKDKLLGRHELLGHNQLALIVPKGNPKNLTADLNQLKNPKLNVVLGGINLGSIGMASKKLLTKAGIAKEVYKNAIHLTSDSRHITNSIKNGDADIALNWLATTFWENNKNFIEAIKVKQTPKKIEVNLLNFSKNKDFSNKFIDFISSDYGLKVFANYGF